MSVSNEPHCRYVVLWQQQKRCALGAGIVLKAQPADNLSAVKDSLLEELSIWDKVTCILANAGPNKVGCC